MANSRKSKNSGLFWLILVVAILVGVIIFFLTYSSTTTSESAVSGNKNSYVSCSRDFQDENNVISTTSPTSVHEEVRATFSNDQLNDVTRTYEGTYASETAATSAESEIHAAYNIYIGSNNNIFSDPSYNIVGDTMKMVLYADSSNYKNSLTKELFLFDPAENSSDPVKPDSFMHDLRSSNFLCQETITSKEEDS